MQCINKIQERIARSGSEDDAERQLLYEKGKSISSVVSWFEYADDSKLGSN